MKSKDKKLRIQPCKLYSGTIFSIAGSLLSLALVYILMNCFQSRFEGNETSVYIACISIVASTIGLSVTAFIFLNDSLKKRAESNESLHRIVSSAIKYKYIELLVVSVVCIVCIVLCIIGNSLNSALHSYYILLRINISLTVGIVVYIIILSATNISSSQVIKMSAGVIVKQERRILEEECQRHLQSETGENAWFYGKLNKGIENLIDSIRQEKQKKVRKNKKTNNSEEPRENRDFKSDFENISYDKIQFIKNLIYQEKSLELAYRRYIVTNNLEDNEKQPSKYTITDFAKIVNQIDVIIKTICKNNIEKTLPDDIDRIKEGMWWLFCDIKNYKPDKLIIDKQDSNRLLDFLHYMLIVYVDEYVAEKNANGATDKKAEEARENKFEELFGAYLALDKEKQKNLIDDFKRVNNLVIEELVDCYDHLLNYQEALMSFTSTKSGIENYISKEIYCLAHTVLHILLDRFCGFVRLGDWNMGGSTFNKAWLNCSDLSNSSFVNSNFKYAHFENGIMKDSDLSVSTFERACLKSANLVGSNLNYCNFKGAMCKNINFSGCLMDGVIFRPVVKGKMRKFIKSLQLNLNYIKTHISDNNRKVELTIDASKVEEGYFTIKPSIKGVYEIVKEINNEIKLPQEGDNEKFSKDLAQDCSDNEDFANLNNATVDNVVLAEVDFSNVPLNSASFKQSVLTSSYISNTRCNGSNFSEANLTNSSFYEVKLHEGILRKANLYNTKFINVIAERINAEEASLMRVIIASDKSPEGGALSIQSSSNLNNKFRSVLYDCNLRKAVAVDAIILNTLLDQSMFDFANLKRAIILNSLLRWTSLIESDLSNGILYGCSFYQANMNRAKLPKCKIDGCDMSNVNFEDTILIHSSISKCIFSQTSFLHANLSKTEFISCFFDGAIFENAIFLDTEFTNCTFCNMEIPFEIIPKKEQAEIKKNESKYTDAEGAICYKDHKFYGVKFKNEK